MRPTFLEQLEDPAIKNVLLCGCGGGFDFLQGVTLLPELRRMGKRVIIGSYSFGLPENIENAEIVHTTREGAIVKLVTAAAEPPADYGPEVHLMSFLDEEWPADAPHSIYAYYARAFTVSSLRSFYQELVEKHALDAVLLIDGGSDSLMRGDEEGLGDPLEDAISVAAVAGLTNVRTKILFLLGLGADRFNGVSDAATLRAIAELTTAGGFLGAISLEPNSNALGFYKRAVDHVYSNQSFRSALTGFILSAAEGHFGGEIVPPSLVHRVRPGKFFLWPLMAILWAFDIHTVAKRSLLVGWLEHCRTFRECHYALVNGRASLPEGPRAIENFPLQEDMVGS